MILSSKKCPICGETFECSHNEHCWCMSLVIAEETKNELRKHYTDCLCKTCLIEFDESQKKNFAK